MHNSQQKKLANEQVLTNDADLGNSATRVTLQRHGYDLFIVFLIYFCFYIIVLSFLISILGSIILANVIGIIISVIICVVPVLLYIQWILSIIKK